ncbi:M23 family metallopeptidase [Polymorphospora rubra]|uniref:M23 family metallopeptidase n=1 Tax=Polymorphospora rubra TaxID=338584 RepID=UPI001BB3DA2B|nr:M23 family metallopeptidase [Polymorphospora rubra]
MSWRHRAPWKATAGRPWTYPVLFLLVAGLGAGCGAPPGATGAGAPNWRASDGGTPSTPPTGTPTTGTAPSAGPATTGPTPPGNSGRRYFFPVAGSNVAYHPTHSAYPATDIFADCGTPVVAVTDGVVLEISRSDTYDRRKPDGPLNGGLFVSLLGDDGVRYYGSHLVEVSAGIDAGVRVGAGQRVGSVGRTGNANNVCHLHFGISPPCAGAGDWWVRRGVVWPAPYLDAWRKKRDSAPADKVAAWQREKGCARTP